MTDSILINTPVSSPLHPQANLPLLKRYLGDHGFSSRLIDSNIMFYHWFLGKNYFDLSIDEFYENPLSILSEYNNIEEKLWEKSQKYEGLQVGLRYLSMKYDRISFDDVVKSLDDARANPFIEFYSNLIDERLVGTGAKIICIALTFQDQIIPAFTLASLVRKKMPDSKIVFGGQMVTRCCDSMIFHKGLSQYYDYLGLWEGEKVLADIHRKLIAGDDVELVNVIDMKCSNHNISRAANAPSGQEIPVSDFSDIHFDEYFFPEMLVPLQTTRGCYASCDFCAIPFGANSYRVRQVDRILEEIESIQQETLDRYGKKATFFKFMEDTSSPKVLFQLSEEIEKRKLDVKWETFARMETAFTKKGFMDQLFRGGCRKIHWGLESNDPDVLKNMKKKITDSHLDEVLSLSAQAGILNFCFVLVGFPGETDTAREKVTEYIINNHDIHTITISTFDLTRQSPMEQNFQADNPYKLEMLPAEDFQVRLPYLIDGKNWKSDVVMMAHTMMRKIVENRPDIGFMTLFPDQVRSILCDKYSNRWGGIFVEKYGQDNIREMLANTDKYVNEYKNNHEIDPSALPEPLRREHFRTKEDLKLIASAIVARKNYEKRRTEQV